MVIGVGCTWSCMGTRAEVLIFLQSLLLPGLRTLRVVFHICWPMHHQVTSAKQEQCVMSGSLGVRFSSRSPKLSSRMNQIDKNKLILTAVCSKPLPPSRQHCEK